MKFELNKMLWALCTLHTHVQILYSCVFWFGRRIEVDIWLMRQVICSICSFMFLWVRENVVYLLLDNHLLQLHSILSPDPRYKTWMSKVKIIKVQKKKKKYFHISPCYISVYSHIRHTFILCVYLYLPMYTYFPCPKY